MTVMTTDGKVALVPPKDGTKKERSEPKEKGALARSVATTAGDDFVLRIHANNKKKVREVAGTTLCEHVPLVDMLTVESSVSTDESNNDREANGTSR